MARQKTNICASCQQVFRGRADKKTCSERCRKRLQRIKDALENEAEIVAGSAQRVLNKIEEKIQPTYATEGGFVGDTAVAPLPAAALKLPPTAPAQSFPVAEPKFAAIPTPAILEPRPLPPEPKQPQAAIPQVQASQPELLTTQPDLSTSTNLPEEPQNDQAANSSQPNLLSEAASQRFRLFKHWVFTTVCAISLMTLLSAVFVSSQHHEATLTNMNKNIPAQSVAVTGASLSSSSPIVLQGNNSAVVINGDLITNGKLKLYGQQYYAQFQTGNLSGNRTYSLPDSSGTLCLNSNNCNFATSAQLAGLATTAQLNQVNQKIGVTLQGSSPGTPDIGNINVSGVIIAGSFSGNGAGLSGLNAGNISLGMLSDARLSANVALLNANQTFTGNDTFSNVVLAPALQAAGASLTLGSSSKPLDLFGDLSSIFKVTDSGNDVTIGFGGTPTGNVIYNFDSSVTPGAYTICTSVGNCTGSGTGDINQGGNSFGAAITLGTNDNFGLNLETNNTTVVSFSNSGAAIFQNSADGAAAFQVQTVASKTVLGADTSSDKVLFGNSGALGITGLAQFNFSGQTGSISLTPANPSSTAYTLNLPAENGTLCSTGSVCSGYAASSGSGNYIQNQNSLDQTADFRISGSGRANTSFLTPLLDTASAGALAIGTTNATSISLNQNTTVAANKSLTANGSATFQDATNSTTAFQVQNTSAKNIMVVDTINNQVVLGTAGASGITGQVKFNFTGQSGSISINANSPSSTNYTLDLPAENGTLCSTGSICSGYQVSGNYFIQGGNSFGATATIGTNDSNSLAFKTNNASQATIASGGATTFKNSSDSTSAFQIQNSDASATLFSADTSNLKITIAGTTSIFASLTLTNAHVKSTQTTAPTIGTPSNCGGGTGPSAAVTSGSTDSAGSFTITAGTTGSPTTCDTVLTFNKAYGAAPKSVIITPTTAAGSATGAKSAQVSATSTTTFTVTITSNPANSEVNSFYYWVIE